MAKALELRREGWKPYFESGLHRPAPPKLTPEEQRERIK